MDYMSENSNVSVVARDLPPVTKAKSKVSISASPSIALPSRTLGDSVGVGAGVGDEALSRPSHAKLESLACSAALSSDPATAPNAHCPLVGTEYNDGHFAWNHQSCENKQHDARCGEEHRPLVLPKFAEIQSCMWYVAILALLGGVGMARRGASRSQLICSLSIARTASWAANYPTEDRSASLVNLLLQPLPPNYDSETQVGGPLEPDYTTLIRLNLWAVIDGHGGGSVATYGSEVLLPHIAASVSRSLNCTIVDRGVCTVNGQLRDANALDLDGLITTSDRSHGHPNSIHYRSPHERSDSEEEEGGGVVEDVAPAVPQTVRERKQIASLVAASMKRPLVPKDSKTVVDVDASVSSVKTSVKTAASPSMHEELLGTHSPREVAAITRAITESFLAVDEGWINSIDPVATHQTSCQNNGRWNSGACALVVFTIQRLDWTDVSEPYREKELRDPETRRLNTSQNRDAARRRMLDYARRTKSASSMSTTSSTSSLTTEEAVHASGIESEITETEGEDDDRSFNAEIRKRDPINTKERTSQRGEESLITPPGGCSCHCYKAHSAMVYTAHVGDCRAVMLGSAPPRTIKVGGDLSSHQDTTDDESSHHSSDETECLSSSDHEADSSEEEDIDVKIAASVAGNPASPSTSAYVNFPRRVVRQRNDRRGATDDTVGPYVALPPLEVSEVGKTVEFDFETNIKRREGRRGTGKEPADSSTSSQNSLDHVPLVQLPASTRPIDLTTDHSAYNPAEVTAVLRRCNNAPKAISSSVGGGIKRVAGSLAVTRALGDAYLKTPLLSFLPYKSHAPYITARPEVNCRPLVKDGDKILVLATDGVWERASGEDVLRWVRNFYEERIAEVERRNRRMNQVDKSQSSDDDSNDSFEPVPMSKNFQQEGSERDLFEKNEPEVSTSRKRELTSSPIGGPLVKRRKRSRQNRISYNVADVIIRRVLNKVRRARNISTLQALMSLPQGRARRSKHDDITASVVDLSAFVA
jgi:serine/threonine protein phosphatase PrpC